MKKNNYFFLLVLSIFFVCCFTACGGDDGPLNPSGTSSKGLSASISQSFLTFDAKESSDQISITVQGKSAYWYIESDAYGWLHIDHTQDGAGSFTIKVTCEENRYAEDRTATLTLIASDEKGNEKTACCTVTQKGRETLTLTKNQFEVDKSGGEIDIQVMSNIDYTYVIEDDAKEWVHESTSASSRASATMSQLHFSIDANEYAKREGHIRIKGGEFSEIITIYQAGDPESVVLTSSDYYVTSEGETLNVVIKSNTTYTIGQPEVSWIKEVTQQSRAMRTHEHYFEVLPNTNSDSRSAYIRINWNNYNSEYIEITQAGRDEAEIEINVTNPGTLSSMIGENRKATITSLKLTGNLNFLDREFIKSMNSLRYLDLKDASLDINSLWGGVRVTWASWEHPFPKSLTKLKLPGCIKSLEDGNYMHNGAYCNGSAGIFGYRFQASQFDISSFHATMESLELSEGTEYIGYYAFANTTIAQLYLPKSSKTIHSRPLGIYRIDIKDVNSFAQIDCNLNLFDDNTKLFCNNELVTKVSLPYGMTELGKAFWGYKYLNSITLPSTLITIEESALSDCSGLTSIEIPPSVLNIGRGALSKSISEIRIGSMEQWMKLFNSQNIPFYPNKPGHIVCNGKYVESIEIPTTVTNLNGAFVCVDGIKEVHCKSKTPAKILYHSYDKSGDFGIIDKDTAVLYVPKGAKQSYYLSDWGLVFKNIAEE